ncbi:hypothetical protein SALBM217S_01389 [Streptomyces griseoloalbus]
MPRLAAVAGFAHALAKLSLDALIQRDVPELVRTSAFARSETLLQMSWVLGGGDRHRAAAHPAVLAVRRVAAGCLATSATGVRPGA